MKNGNLKIGNLKNGNLKIGNLKNGNFQIGSEVILKWNGPSGPPYHSHQRTLLPSYTHLVRLLKAQNGSNPEKNGTKTILVSLEAEFFVEQHILKSAPGKSC